MVTQDTGLDERLPVGDGLFPWCDLSGARVAVQASPTNRCDTGRRRAESPKSTSRRRV
jgi:hypothetical protein